MFIAPVAGHLLLVPHMFEPVASEGLSSFSGELVVIEHRLGSWRRVPARLSATIAAPLVAARVALLMLVVRGVVVVAGHFVTLDLVLPSLLVPTIRVRCLKWLLIVVRRLGEPGRVLSAIVHFLGLSA